MTDKTDLHPLSALRPWLEERGIKKPLVLSGPERRFVQEVTDALGMQVGVFDRATVHVPAEIVKEASAAIGNHDALIALGGGSATGLGKALRLEHDLPFVAIPTTYAGSEMTNIYGISKEGKKETGRDEKVRPDFVVADPAFTKTMPKKLSITSLVNALAHPISARSAADGNLSGADLRRMEEAIRLVTDAILQIVVAPESVHARRWAAEGAAKAAVVLDAGNLGVHHHVVHALGGRFRADHSQLHAMMLPHAICALPDDVRHAVSAAADIDDLPAWIYDALRRVEAPVSLRELEIDRASLDALRKEKDLPAWVDDAWLGLRPSLRTTYDREKRVLYSGAPVGKASRIVVAVHGRGANAGRISEEVRAIVGDAPDIAIVAPQANGAAWCDASYRDAATKAADAFAQAKKDINAALDEAIAKVGAANTFLFGFSQGGCLALELMATTPRKDLGGVIALSGARYGKPDDYGKPVDLHGLRMIMGVSDGEKWLDAPDVDASVNYFRQARADLTFLAAPGDAHEVRVIERVAARRLIRPETNVASTGFDNHHEHETLPGALPKHQNSPRHAPYGLFPEQINGSGFVAPRATNVRSWMYRVRPANQHTAYEPIDHPTFSDAFTEAVDPNLSGFDALPIPEEANDFVDGVHTFGGQGSAALRRGYAIHLYAANRNMEHRAFTNADGDWLVIPQEGALLFQTEMGVLDVSPGQIAILPRGLRFSVLLPEGRARGYIGEAFGRSFHLPERGPVGANGLADGRHFVTPTPYHEDRLDRGYRLTSKLGGKLFEARQDYSPFDVAAWHGNMTPLRYDLTDFSPVANARIDHPDPSIYSVLSAPMDEVGAHALDFVVFPPRWDATEHTFRPPFYHRNATTEFNGIVRDPHLRKSGPFSPGCYFLTPSMTAHGVLHQGVEHAFRKTNEQADKPDRASDDALWFQFETALPIALTPWAARVANRRSGWREEWGVARTRFQPWGNRPRHWPQD